jgi:hypothetical protein
MKKMIVTLPGASDCRGSLFSDAYSTRKLNACGDLIAYELGSAPTAILMPESHQCRQTADAMGKKLYASSEYIILPTDEQFAELNRDVESLLLPEFERLSYEIDRLGKGHEGMLMISSQKLANSFPSYYARKRGFGERFIPWMSDCSIAVLDFVSGRTYSLSCRETYTAKNLRF